MMEQLGLGDHPTAAKPKVVKSVCDLSANEMFQRITPRVRTLLKRSMHIEFVRRLEERLDDELQVARLDPADLEITLEIDAFHRLLAHGICQYYGFETFSQDTDDDNRVLVIRFAEGCDVPEDRLLSKYLLSIEASSA
eukprot:c5420_g1_i3.p1 GENE.c5420_g1_i3~~c5420_g1_i3.p1  ORF type:complete len:138 (-),score=34.84 c5420_g1_i3:3-416(-)